MQVLYHTFNGCHGVQDLALIDARKGVAMFRKSGVSILGLVENMSHYACPACGHRDDIFGSQGAVAAASEMGLNVLGQVQPPPAVPLLERNASFRIQAKLQSSTQTGAAIDGVFLPKDSCQSSARATACEPGCTVFCKVHLAGPLHRLGMAGALCSSKSKLFLLAAELATIHW